MKIDKRYIQNICREILVAVRENHSQTAINRKLGYDYNIISRWESGYTKISWSDFTLLCSVTRTPLKDSLRQLFGHVEQSSQIHLLFKKLLRSIRSDQFYELMGYSKTSLKKWSTESSKVSLQAVVSLIFLNGMLPSFVETILPKQEVPSLKYELAQISKIRKFFSLFPEAEVILYYFSLTIYKSSENHDNIAISKLISISLERLELILSKLTEASLIKKVDGKYMQTFNPLTHTGGGDEQSYIDSYKMKNFWLEKAVLELDKKINKDSSCLKKTAFSNALFPVSNEASEAINGKTLRFFREIMEIVENDKNEKEQILGINYNVISLINLDIKN